MSDKETVRVPWVIGSEVKAPPFQAAPLLSPRIRAERKRGQIVAAIAWCELHHHENELAFQRRRLGWLDAAMGMAEAALAARRKAIEDELGAEGLGFAAQGLPADRLEDQRLTFGLAELALVRLVQGV